MIIWQDVCGLYHRLEDKPSCGVFHRILETYRLGKHTDRRLEHKMFDPRNADRILSTAEALEECPCLVTFGEVVIAAGQDGMT